MGPQGLPQLIAEVSYVLQGPLPYRRGRHFQDRLLTDGLLYLLFIILADEPVPEGFEPVKHSSVHPQPREETGEEKAEACWHSQARALAGAMFS